MSSVEASVCYTCGESGIALTCSLIMLIVLNHGYQSIYTLLVECKTYYIKSKVSVTGQP